MWEDISSIITADRLEELDKLWPRRGLGTLQLAFFCSGVHLSNKDGACRGCGDHEGLVSDLFGTA